VRTPFIVAILLCLFPLVAWAQKDRGINPTRSKSLHATRQPQGTLSTRKNSDPRLQTPLTGDPRLQSNRIDVNPRHDRGGRYDYDRQRYDHDRHNHYRYNRNRYYGSYRGYDKYRYRYPSYRAYGSSVLIGVYPQYRFGYYQGDPRWWLPYDDYPYGISPLYPYGNYYSRYEVYPNVEPVPQFADLYYSPGGITDFLSNGGDQTLDYQVIQSLNKIAAPLSGDATASPSIPQPSLQAIARAENYIQSGDGLFGQQRYQEALGRYKDAISAAPGYPDAHLRKALAYLATNRPEEAVEALKIAVSIDPNVATTPLSLLDLVGNNALARDSIIEANARRAVADPQNADLLYVIGVLLHFDGRNDQAVRYLAAAKNAGGAAGVPYIDAFLSAYATSNSAGLDL